MSDPPEMTGWRHGVHEVTVRRAVAPDRSVRVLLQLPDGYLLMRTDDARTVADALTEVADHVDAEH